MPVIKRSTVVPQDKATIYSILKNMEYFPRFIKGVESINVKHLSDNLVVSNWRINVQDTIVTWEEEDIFNDKNYSIDFRMREGDYGSYEGNWKLLENGSGTEVHLTARIDWNLSQNTKDTTRYLNKKAELALRWMLREIRKNALNPPDLLLEPFWQAKSKIISEQISFRNKDGKNIIGFYDHLDNATIRDHFVISPPGYGETKRDALTTSYYLVKNGFNVIRYDATDHIGESDGEIIGTTMTKMKNDLLGAIDYVEQAYGVKKVGVVASSLAKRMAIKAASEDKRIVFLLGVVGVVNLQHTLNAVYNEDIIGDVESGKIKAIYDVMGFEVSKEYPVSAIKDNYHDLLTTQKDLENINIPVVFLVAENDAWVKLDDVRFVIESSKADTRELHVIPDAMHQLFENPKAAHVAMKQIVVSCFKYLRGNGIDFDQVIAPTMREMAAQNRIEKDRLRKLTRRSVQEEKEFWAKYIVDFAMLKKVPDYREFLDSMVNALLPLKTGQVVLDAGCGVGYFGIWLATKLTEEGKRDRKIRYIGLDFLESNLRQAKQNHKGLLRQFSDTSLSFQLQYDLADLNDLLPYASDSYDKICCNLVISYLKNPDHSIRELFRVLKPGGVIAISTLKPYADLSEIYRHFISQAESEQDLVEARKLLSSAGQIKRREGEGHYYFFSEKELKTLMVGVGAQEVKTFRSFGNQANVVVAAKGQN